ncbi:hypothetical protein [Wenyingzhuangia sp. IMCC45574]
MKKFLIFFILISEIGYSQSSIGFIDNYSGVNASIYNPASILNTPYKRDFNIFSVNGNLGNTYYSFNIPKFFSDLNFGIDDVIPAIQEINTTGGLSSDYGVGDTDEYVYYKNPSKNSNFYGSFNIQGPSALFSINRNKAFAVSTGIKLYSNVYNVDSEIFNRIFYNLLSVGKYSMATDFLFELTAWQEIAFTYAFVSEIKPIDYFKMGFTFKVLKGLYTRSVFGDDISVNLNFNNDFLNTGEVFSGLKGEIINISNLPGTDLGLGLDFGFVYEKRSVTTPIAVKENYAIKYYKTAPYKYRIGFSVTDLGFLLFNNVVKSTNKIKISAPLLGSFMLDNFDYTTTYNHSVNLLLPATARFNFDYNFNHKFFINLNVDAFLYPYSHRFTVKNVSKIDVSPRYESKHFSAFIPLSVNVFGEARAGIGFRTGYFFMGSGSFFNHLTKYATELDFNFGFKIPVYSKKYRKEFNESLKNETQLN